MAFLVSLGGQRYEEAYPDETITSTTTLAVIVPRLSILEATEDDPRQHTPQENLHSSLGGPSMFGPLIGVMMPLGEGINLKVSCDQREWQETYGSSCENGENDIDKGPSELIIIIDVMVFGDHTSVRYLFGTEVDRDRTLLIPHRIGGIRIEDPFTRLGRVGDHVRRVVGVGMQFDDLPKPDHKVSLPSDIGEQHRNSIGKGDWDKVPLLNKLSLTSK